VGPVEPEAGGGRAQRQPRATRGHGDRPSSPRLASHPSQRLVSVKDPAQELRLTATDLVAAGQVGCTLKVRAWLPLPRQSNAGRTVAGCRRGARERARFTWTRQGFAHRVLEIGGVTVTRGTAREPGTRRTVGNGRTTNRPIAGQTRRATKAGARLARTRKLGADPRVTEGWRITKGPSGARNEGRLAQLAAGFTQAGPARVDAGPGANQAEVAIARILADLAFLDRAMRDPSARYIAATVLGNAVGARDGAGSAFKCGLIGWLFRRL
jgi:hypothetical protein